MYELTKSEAMQLLSSYETAELLNVNTRILEGWRRRGEGPRFIRINQSCVRYRMGDLAAFMEKHLVEAGTAA